MADDPQTLIRNHSRAAALGAPVAVLPSKVNERAANADHDHGPALPCGEALRRLDKLHEIELLNWLSRGR